MQKGMTGWLHSPFGKQVWSTGDQNQPTSLKLKNILEVFPYLLLLSAAAVVGGKAFSTGNTDIKPTGIYVLFHSRKIFPIGKEPRSQVLKFHLSLFKMQSYRKSIKTTETPS